MKQTLELNKMELASMSEFEMMEVDGGSFWDLIQNIGTIIVGITLAAATIIASALLAASGNGSVIAGILGGGGLGVAYIKNNWQK